MLWKIVQKEIFDNLLNLQFVVACVVVVLLIIGTMMALAGSYRAEIADYNDRQIVQEDFIAHYGHLNRVGWMAQPLRPPVPYGYLVQGIDREAKQENFLSNPVRVLFSSMDLVVIVSTILSLVAILFSYNSISGEREEGMLRQMLSTNVSRSAIIFGKFIGGCVSLLLPFIIGMLAGLIYLSVSPGVQLAGAQFEVFSLLVAGSILYISIFYALGLYFSARSRSSGDSLLKSLFAWVVLVLLLPNSSPFLAARLYHLPSRTKVDMQAWTLRSEERDQIVAQRTQELIHTKYADIADDLLNSFFGAGKTRSAADTAVDPARKARYAQYKDDWMAMVNQINDVQNAKAAALYNDFNERSKYQEKLATIFTSVSPLGNYVFIASDLAEAGIQADNYWQEQREEYFTTMNPILTSIYKDALKLNPRLTVNDFIDLRNFPRFHYQPVPLNERGEAALPHSGVLAFFNILFLAGAWASFMKYDVR